jgi:hypothetical protein
MSGFPYNRAYIPLGSRAREGVSVRTFLGVLVIAVGVVNLCLQHRWHRVLGVVAIAVGLTLCALAWVR